MVGKIIASQKCSSPNLGTVNYIGLYMKKGFGRCKVGILTRGSYSGLSRWV